MVLSVPHPMMSTPLFFLARSSRNYPLISPHPLIRPDGSRPRPEILQRTRSRLLGSARAKMSHPRLCSSALAAAAVLAALGIAFHSL